MPNYAIACGCGRTMNLDGRNGRGAYRCGCGARIRIAERPGKARVCWFDECEDLATTEMPLSLCQVHEREAVNHLAHLIVRFDWGAVLEASQAISSSLRPLDGYAQAKETPGWIYFMRREHLIKIGTTTDLRRRAQQLNAEILARTPGSYAEEKRLHHRFASLRRHGEWFEPAPELMSLINAIRAEEGLPALPG